MKSYKKNTVEKQNRNANQSNILECKSFCLICRRVHKLTSNCNQESSRFVKHHMLGLYDKANEDEKLKLIQILYESRLKLMKTIEQSLPDLMEHYISSQDNSSIPYRMITKDEQLIIQKEE